MDMDSQDFIKNKILVCMWEDDALHCKVSGIARTLGVQKYTVSRAMMRLEQEGLVDRTDKFTPRLTPAGCKAAERFYERFQIGLHHLLYEGVPPAQAEKDAFVWAMYCSNAMMDAMRGCDGIYRMKSSLNDMAEFDGKALCENMKDGDYTFPFLFYRDKIKNNNNISMANAGFSHPCTLHVEKGKGTVRLKIVSMHHKSGLNGMSMEGEVSSFAYCRDGDFLNVPIREENICFPMDAIKFIPVGQIFYGSLYVKLQCSVGPAHMPESQAIFAMFI